MSLLSSREERVLRLTLNRPDKRNALSSELCMQLANAIEIAWGDANVGCVLIDAHGDVFCAGMDLEEVTTASGVQKSGIHERLFTLIAHARKPVVSAVQGPALGGGVGLIANSHIAIAAHGCTFGLTEIRVGMWPFVIWRSIVLAIGERKAIELSLSGRIFHLPEAIQWGLISEAVPAMEVDDRATAVAHHLANSSSQAMEAGLMFASRSRGKDWTEAGHTAAEFRAEAFRSSDFAEGVRAFQEKRKPVWSFRSSSTEP